MNADKTSNAPPSATTSTNGHNKLDEAAYLAQQNAEAKEAVTRTLEELKESLKTAADIQLWTRQHPWVAVGVAAAAGFAAATAVTPSPAAEVQEKLERLEQYERGRAPAAASAAGARSGPNSAMNSLLKPLFDMAKVAVQSSIASAIAGAMHNQASQADTQSPQDQAPQEQPTYSQAGEGI